MDTKPEIKEKRKDLRKHKYIPQHKKELLKVDVERAMRNTMSNNAAARYLGVNVKTYKKYASRYTDEEGNNLYEKHLNQAAAGVPKYSLRTPGNSQLMDIMEGRLPKSFISLKIFKHKLIIEGFLKEECCRCGYHEKRILDEKAPILLHFIDGNKKNWKLENLEFLCYNCYYLTVGEVFEKKQLEALEDFNVKNNQAIDFELPENKAQLIKESINLENKYIYKSDDEDKKDDYGADLIASFRK